MGLILLGEPREKSYEGGLNSKEARASGHMEQRERSWNERAASGFGRVLVTVRTLKRHV
jgi:hypothetical protein